MDRGSHGASKDPIARYAGSVARFRDRVSAGAARRDPAALCGRNVMAGGGVSTLREFLEERVLVLDGATGSALQQRHLTAEDFGGPALEGCNENLVLTRPDVVADLHPSYFDAAAPI